MPYPLSMLDGIDDETGKKLKSAGIRTSTGLLEAAKDTRGRKALSERTGLSTEQLLEWANAADRMRIKGMGREFSRLVVAAGVKTIRELKHRNVGRLARAIAEANRKRPRVKVPPSEKTVSRWVEQAKKLPLKISY